LPPEILRRHYLKRGDGTAADASPTGLLNHDELVL